ncbi:MAG: helix-turn-helix transcriptional regulator [Spirochaetaceae bacterium]|nr:helix-turn-helix transcriptional regulator [Spirochaetaceae bacterium]
MYERVIHSLHEAMLDDGRWREASALIDQACGTAGTHLAIGDSPSCEVKSLPGARSIRMDGTNGLQVIWVFANATKPGGWTAEQTAMINRLVPHIRQFVRVRQALVGAEALSASLAGLLDNMVVGVICLDSRGMIVQVNARAQEILREGAGLVERRGVLRAKQTADDERLSRLLAHALSQPGRPGTSGSMTVARTAQRPRLALHVIPADVRDVEFPFGLVAGLVVVVDPAAKAGIDPESVAAGLGLTRAEGRVASALAQGATMRDIATTHRAESTVRELVKRIHLKLNISRRADLVRMVLSLAASQSPRLDTPLHRGEASEWARAMPADSRPCPSDIQGRGVLGE